MPAPTTPFNIGYETDHYLIREMELSDASDTIGGWMADPVIARAVNAPARATSMDDLRRYIAGHNRIDGHLLGVFDKHTKAQIGLWSVYVDWDHMEFLINVLLTARGHAELAPSRETGRPLLFIMFNDLGMERMRFNVLGSNQRVKQRLVNRQPEHASQAPSATGSGTEEIHHYSVSRQEYFKLREARLQKEAEELLQKAG